MHQWKRLDLVLSLIPCSFLPLPILLPPSTMQKKVQNVFVHGLDGKSVTILVDDGCTVESLKASICKKTNLPVDRQRLLFPGSNFAVMMDEAVLPKGEMVNVQMLLVGGVAGGGGGQSKAKKGGKEKTFLEPKKKKKADGDGAASPVKKKSSARKKENPLFDEDDAAATSTSVS